MLPGGFFTLFEILRRLECMFNGSESMGERCELVRLHLPDHVLIRLLEHRQVLEAEQPEIVVR